MTTLGPFFIPYDELMSPLSPNGPKVVTWPQCRQKIINVKIETDWCKFIDKITQFSCIKTVMFTWICLRMCQYDMIWWYDMIWYDMIWYDMIWYDMIMRYVMEYSMKCEMRYDEIISYDVAYEWYGMVWCYIHCWEKGEIGCHTPYLTIFAHSVCCVWCVASLC